MVKKHGVYFEAFSSLAQMAQQAAVELHQTLLDFGREDFKARMAELHGIEHAADDIKHEMMKQLAREFVTPIEREDIIHLANEIDELVDTIEDVLIRMYMYDIQVIRPEALAFSEVIVRCCTTLCKAMAEFPNFHKSKVLHGAVVAVNTLEEEGDTLYIDAMHQLFSEGGNAVDILAWSQVFDRLEDCCDTCEHVANVVESITMKNA